MNPLAQSGPPYDQPPLIDPWQLLLGCGGLLALAVAVAVYVVLRWRRRPPR